jgi:hypothetical protein
MTTSAPAEPTAQPSPGQGAADGHGWSAVSIVLVGAFMARLDSSTLAINTQSG